MKDYRYLAGLTDADGSISLTFEGNTRRFYARLYFMMHMSSELESFLQSMGLKKEGSGKGKAIRYSIRNQKAADLIEKILPYLKLKKNRARLVLQTHAILPKRYGTFTEENVKKIIELHEQIREMSCRKTKRVWTKEKIYEAFGLGHT
jgi:hypothetical protein